MSSELHAVPMSNETHPIPWEDRPPGSAATLWRSSLNPIIARDHLPRSNSIFNSAVVPFGSGFAGVFRIDDTSRTMNLHAGFSADGIDWEIDERPIAFTSGDPRVAEIQETFEHAYDPRVTWLDDRYYVTWCNGYHGPDDRSRVHARLHHLPPARQCVPPVQPQRCPVPAPGRRPLPDAQPPERQRPHALRRHLLLREPRPDPLGPAPPRDGHAALVVGVDEDRRRPDSDRDRRGLAHDLPRRPHLVQRVRLLDGRGAARSRRALARDRASERLPPLAAGRRTSRWGTCRT